METFFCCHEGKSPQRRIISKGKKWRKHKNIFLKESEKIVFESFKRVTLATRNEMITRKLGRTKVQLSSFSHFV